MTQEEIKQAIRNGFGIEYNVRKMSNDEIYNPENRKYWVSDETGHIFLEEELTFIE